MASIDGLSLKKVKTWVGREGVAFQGDLYLGKTKIAFWSQDGNGCIEDQLDMEPKYSEKKLREAIVAAHPEKHEEKVSASGTPYALDYELETLMTDLLSLRESEKAWKRAKKNGYGGLLEITDGFHVSQWQLPETFCGKSVENIKKEIEPKQISEAMEQLFKNVKAQENVFWAQSDFEIGKPLDVKQIEIDH